MPRRNLLGTSLLVMALAGLAVAAFFIFQPFLTTLTAAVLITTVAHPLFAKVLALVGPERRGLASGISCVLVILLVVLPAILCGLMVAKELGEDEPVDDAGKNGATVEAPPAAGSAGEGSAGGAGETDEGWWKPLLGWWEPLFSWGTTEVGRQFAQLRRDLQSLSKPPEVTDASTGAPDATDDPEPPDEDLEEKPAFSLSAGAIANVLRWVSVVFGTLLAGVLGVVVKCLLMVFIMFYFFRDGPRILRSVQRALAIDPTYQEKVVEKFKVVSVGMLRGIVATALTQGVIGGVALSFLGLKPFLFGSLVALCALVPVAGTGLVTIPVTIYFLVKAMYWQAAVAAVIVVLISSLDNILRPIFVQGDLQLHPVWILLSILGGVGCFGALGLILGPMVVVLLRTILALVAEESQGRAHEKA